MRYSNVVSVQSSPDTADMHSVARHNKLACVQQYVHGLLADIACGFDWQQHALLSLLWLL